jgi:VWFA-related protein
VLIAAGLLAAAAAATGSSQRPPVSSVDVVVVQPETVTASQAVPWKAVRGLAREDFALVVDGQPRAIESFAIDTRPVSVVVLLDVSASTEVRIDSLLPIVEKGLIPALEAGDRVSFGRFGGTGLRVDGRFTGVVSRDVAAAAKAVLARPRSDEAVAPPAVGSPSVPPLPMDPVLVARAYNGAYGVGASPVWDAVDAAVAALDSEPGRRAIVMLTDGRSTGNVHSFDEAIEHASAAGVMVSVAGEALDLSVSQGGATRARIRASAFLDRLAAATGGGHARIFGPESVSPGAFGRAAIEKRAARILASLVDDLRGAYRLGFTPPMPERARHRVEVRVARPGATARLVRRQ